MKRVFPWLVAIVAVGAFVLMAFPPRDDMRSAVINSGFREVQLAGFAWFGCSEQDTFRQKWKGHSSEGKPVTGVVCGGLLKGWTVRLT